MIRVQHGPFAARPSLSSRFHTRGRTLTLDRQPTLPHRRAGYTMGSVIRVGSRAVSPARGANRHTRQRLADVMVCQQRLRVISSLSSVDSRAH